MWYEYYLKPFSMVIQKSDLFYAYEDEDGEAPSGSNAIRPPGKEGECDCREDDADQDGTTVTATLSDGSGSNSSKKTKKKKNSDSGVSDDSDDEEIGENRVMRRQSSLILCNEDDENARCYISLPPAALSSSQDNEKGAGLTTTTATATPRCVDGTCALCIDEYEEGDVVVWSNLQCSHVFHKDCLMMWLSKGKKRCPVCRHWFVPGSKIDDQKIAHGESWERALQEMEEQEAEEAKKAAREVASSESSVSSSSQQRRKQQKKRGEEENEKNLARYNDSGEFGVLEPSEDFSLADAIGDIESGEIPVFSRDYTEALDPADLEVPTDSDDEN